MKPDEARLDAIRREAAETGTVSAPGVPVQGGPLPAPPPGDAPRTAPAPGYHGRPVIKPPPWTWEVPVYFFVGGLAGASAVLALASRLGGYGPPVVRAALWIALWGSVASAALLVSDLGRPARFLHMLRVFKWRSPMSVGVWVLTAFGGAVGAALVLERVEAAGHGWLSAPLWLALGAAALLGSLVATYTGVLLSATVVPAWTTHARTLPVHFGAAALGSAAAAIELLGYRMDALHVLGLLAAATETAVGGLTELDRHGAKDRALREGRSGLLVRAAAVLAGPASLLLRLVGWRGAAATAFLAGAFLSRFGWLEAGRASAGDPEGAL